MMISDDPFAEPFDTDKTVIRPNPGGRRQTTAKQPSLSTQPARPAPSAPPVSQAGLDSNAPVVPTSIAATGMNPLNAAASTLFSLVARIRNRAQHSDPAALRQSVVNEIRTFGNTAQQNGVPVQSIRAARYAICATIDDVVLNTPWGGQSIWAQQSMVGTFHKETHGGDRFYELLSSLEKAPSQNIDLLEFLYMCLSLGFEGRLRVEARGSEKHLHIRDGLARLIRTHRGDADRDLSPHWRGVDVAHRILSNWVPVWVTAGVVLAGMCLLFFGFSFALSKDTDLLRDKITALNVSGPVVLERPAPPPPPPPLAPKEVEAIETVSAFLEPEIKEGLVSVEKAGNTLVVRLAGQGMFPSASDHLEKRFETVVDRVAEALDGEEGKIIVAGHSDNIPISTARFPSNRALSLARAKSVMNRISEKLSDKDRISAEGRADKEPIASNDTAEGRAKNRRIEVILVKAS
nr:type IVB secretion system protein IcmH/DotU [uncultured Cohaesibacter sp.]